MVLKKIVENDVRVWFDTVQYIYETTRVFYTG